MRSRTLILFIVVFFIFFACSAYAEGEIVTSKTLSVDDVTPFMTKVAVEKGAKFNKTMGVYQEGKKAIVYIDYENKGKKSKLKYTFFQFNSGKWFCPYNGLYLTK